MPLTFSTRLRFSALSLAIACALAYGGLGTKHQHNTLFQRGAG